MKGKVFTNITIPLTFLCLLCVLPAAAKGVAKRNIDAETELAEIDLLIDDTDYNIALNSLKAHIEKYPDYFEEAQKRIDRILKARQLYAKKAEQLVQVIQNEPENNEKILAIIAELESLERNPSAAQLAFVRDARKAAQFNLFRTRFVQINEKAKSLFDNEKYGEAVDTYLTGFNTYRSEFFAENEGKPEAETARNALAKIEGNVPRYKSLQKKYGDAVAAYIAAAGRKDFAAAQTRYAELQVVFRDFAEVRNTIFDGGAELSALYDDMTGGGDVIDASFLPFVVRYAQGTGSDRNLGIIGVMDGQWDRNVARLKNSTTQAITGYNNDFLSLSTGGFFETGALVSGTELASATNFASLGTGINNFYELLKTDDGTKAGLFPAYEASMNFETGIAKLLGNVVNVVSDLKKESQAVAALTAPAAPPETERAGNSNYINRLAGSVKVFENISDVAVNYANEDWYVAYKTFAAKNGASQKIGGTAKSPEKNESKSKKKKVDVLNLGDASSDEAVDFSDLEDKYKTAASEIDNFVNENLSIILVKIGEHYKVCGTEYVSEAETNYAAAHDLYEGISRTEDGTGYTTVIRQPDKVIAMMDDLSVRISGDRAILVKGYEVLSEKKYAGFAGTYASSVSDSIARLDRINTNIAGITVGARQMLARADEAQKEAELRYRQAQNAYEAKNYELAQRRLQESRAKYNEALSYKESDELRAYSDRILTALGESILRAENEVIVAEVRRMKTQARTEYYNGNFEEAESILTRAADRWAVTNIDEDVEITNLMALVMTALSVSSGRVIPFTSPLYPEMSQILSIARTYFGEGQQLINEGKKAEGKEKLEMALVKIQELQLVYPWNQEASLLSLRINQMLDPEGFNALFKTKVDDARASYKNPATQREAYTMLKDLYEINPNYPGLSQLIYDVEISIGVRQKPVDTTSLTRSTNLSSQAQQIVNAAGRDTAQLRQALALVEEAVTLNPNNDTAMLLKDRIQIALGGGAAIVLSAEDEAMYQEAIQAMQRNNIVAANALVEQLLQKANNRRSSKILDLQKQIRALL